MYITVKEAQTLDKFYHYMMEHATIYGYDKGLCDSAHNVLIALYSRRKATNANQYARIKEKRKDNPNYARPQKEWRRRICKKIGEN